MEEWAAAQGGSGIADFKSKDGEVEAELKDIAERAAGKGTFHYSRFFAIGLFRLLECANASDPTVLESVSRYMRIQICLWLFCPKPFDTRVEEMQNDAVILLNSLAVHASR